MSDEPFIIYEDPEHEPDKVTFVDPSTVLVGDEAVEFLKAMGLDDMSALLVDGFDDDSHLAQYDDDPNPYHGTYSEE